MCLTARRYSSRQPASVPDCADRAADKLGNGSVQVLSMVRGSNYFVDHEAAQVVPSSIMKTESFVMFTLGLAFVALHGACTVGSATPEAPGLDAEATCELETLDNCEADGSTPIGTLASASGGCSANFAPCVTGGGGAACATRWCTGACVSEVASCIRGSGGAACSNRCTGPTCTPKELWTEIWTWECGFSYGWGNQNAGAPGKAHATCTQQCNGAVNNCSIWHYNNGRAQCTLGVPLDSAQNPW